jgi:hypothetical protein
MQHIFISPSVMPRDNPHRHPHQNNPAMQSRYIDATRPRPRNAICHICYYYIDLPRSDLRCNTTTPKPINIPPYQPAGITSGIRQKRTLPI